MGEFRHFECGIFYFAKIQDGGQNSEKKIASDIPLPHSPKKYFSTPWDIEEMKQYKIQETFTANDISYVKIRIMSVEKITFKRENNCKLWSCKI